MWFLRCGRTGRETNRQKRPSQYSASPPPPHTKEKKKGNLGSQGGSWVGGESAREKTRKKPPAKSPPPPPPQYSGKDILVKIYLPRMKVIAGFAVPVQALRCDARCYFNVRSKADISQLNLPHGTDN